MTARLNLNVLHLPKRRIYLAASSIHEESLTNMVPASTMLVRLTRVTNWLVLRTAKLTELQLKINK